MKKFFISILLLLTVCTINARHIKGGFFTYTYLGPGTTNTNFLKYKITLTVYMECDATGDQIDNTVGFTIFDGLTNQQLYNPQVLLKTRYKLEKRRDEPCITGDQRECYYLIVIYELDNFELPVSANGYNISYQRCCRIDNVDNLRRSGDMGNTYSIKIPGTASPVLDANKNNSPSFPVNDTVVVCGGSFFSYPFSATDSNNDSLVYSLCAAYDGGLPPPGNPAPNPALAPPYAEVSYTSGFSGSIPMGSNVSIDSKTGTISGIAPNIIRTGEYVITVCVGEYRNGIFFGETRKELHIKVKDCSPLTAKLNNEYRNCKTYVQSLTNVAANPSGTNYSWNFGDPASGINNTSNAINPSHTFSDTGTYFVKLLVSTTGGLCADSTTTKVMIYPGFSPSFAINSPLCVGSPIQFNNTSTTTYGTITNQQWDFGDLSIGTDKSDVKVPSYTYNSAGNYKVEMIVTNSYNCIDTAEKDIVIFDKPLLTLFPKDTLICSIDTLQVSATGNGSVAWSPNYMISSLSSKTPLVSPDIPTKYFVNITDVNGCRNNDSMFIDVRTSVSVKTINDTTICLGDTIRLNTISEGLQYEWTPSTNIITENSKNPQVFPVIPTKYSVIANIGKCQASDEVNINVVPYPTQLPKKDTGVCFGSSLVLNASGGSSYKWSPNIYLSADNIASPRVIEPKETTQYIVAVTDNKGCPKPVYDTFNVKVVDPIAANAGPRDTAIVIGEPLQLTGTGGDIYSWSPIRGLSNPDAANPIANISSNIQYILTASTLEGCKGTDTISVKVYTVDPDIYVPSAFTPNGDGNNDIFKPILLGMKQLSFFNVYNRWGQLVFSTNQNGVGWDGTINGKKQDPATFIWSARGINYQGKQINKKGHVVLIR